jgi:galactokinase
MPASALELNNRELLTQLTKDFWRRYGVAPQVFRAPGRVNLIGEHTDYNDGFVLPVALEFSSYVAITRRDDRKIAVYSRNVNDCAEFSLDDSVARPTGHWSDYVRGVAGVLQEAEIPVSGANMMISGNVPLGSGLSSSASLEVASALAFLACSEVSMERVAIAQLCQRAEHQYVGTQCGIMDQFVACYGEENRAILLDCRSLAHQALAVDPAIRIVICNTRIKHDLAASEYNRRRLDCEDGVRRLATKLSMPVHALRDVNLMDLEHFREDLPELLYRRCRHVVTENDRVQKAVVALQARDMDAFGALMVDSHRSLRDDYEVSCPELDLMVDLARTLPGVYGARMTGGGFGGCTVNLVRAGAAEDFKAAIQREYTRARGLEPEVYICRAAAGAGPVSLKLSS